MAHWLPALHGLDLWLLQAVNEGLSNAAFDAAMPVFTNLDRLDLAVAAAGLSWLGLLAAGGPAGRRAAVLLVLAVVLSDHLTSELLKPLVDRDRPCRADGALRVLVSCGAGSSFPSAHAANAFAAALVLSRRFPRRLGAFLAIAALVAFSRVYVGVHYPSDVVGGAAVGLASGALVLGLWRLADALARPGSGGRRAGTTRSGPATEPGRAPAPRTGPRSCDRSRRRGRT